MNILIFGGDSRQIAAAEYFEKNGHTVSIYAIEKKHLEKKDAGRLFSDTFEQTDAIVFPLPLSRDGKTINCPLSDETYGFERTIMSIKPGTKIFAGLINKYQRSLFDELKLDAVDYYDIEELQIRNSVPTAEGAIEIYMTKSEKTVMESRTVVVGYGKIAKALSARLCYLGAYVKVVARSKKDLAAAACFGCEGETINSFRENPGKADCIFNTVPCNLFGTDFASKLQKNTLFIDLASKPFGITPAAAEMLGEKYITASSLPGRLFPHTAGVIIGETVCKLLDDYC